MSTESLLDRPRLTQILERFRAELEAIAREQLARINILRGRVIELTDIVCDNFARCEAIMDKVFVPAYAQERRAQRDLLPLRAQAFYAADLLADEEQGIYEEGERKQLFERVAEHDLTLLGWARPLFGRDAVLAKVLDDIERGKGYRDDADDVVRLVRVFWSNWAKAEGKTPVDAAYLKESEADATEALAILDKKNAQARVLARQAFTAWRTDYLEVVATGRYLLRNEPKVNELFPGIHAVKNRRSRVENAPADTTPGDAEPAPESSDPEPTPPTQG